MCSKCSGASGTETHACPSFPRQPTHREETPQDRQASDLRRGNSGQLLPGRKAPAAMGLPGWDGRQDQQHGGRRQILRVPFGTYTYSPETPFGHETRGRRWMRSPQLSRAAAQTMPQVSLGALLLPKPLLKSCQVMRWRFPHPGNAWEPGCRDCWAVVRPASRPLTGLASRRSGTERGDALG